MADPSHAHRPGRFPLTPALAGRGHPGPLPVDLGDGRAGVRWQRGCGALLGVLPPSWPCGPSLGSQLSVRPTFLLTLAPGQTPELSSEQRVGALRRKGGGLCSQRQIPRCRPPSVGFPPSLHDLLVTVMLAEARTQPWSPHLCPAGLGPCTPPGGRRQEASGLLAGGGGGRTWDPS